MTGQGNKLCVEKPKLRVKKKRGERESIRLTIEAEMACEAMLYSSRAISASTVFPTALTPL